jgi:hypothetical protein
VFAVLRRSIAVVFVASCALVMVAPPPLLGVASAAGQGSVRMDGASSLITVADNPGLRLTTNFTLEVRAKPMGNARQTTMFGKSFYELSMFPASGGVQFALVVRQGAWREARSPVLPLGRWYTVAGSYDGAFLRLFVDGELVTSSALTGSIETSSRPLYLGSVEGNGDIFDGFIDEVRVSDVARWRESYTVTPQPFTPDANTMGLWHLDEGSGTTTADASGKGGTGSLVNGVAWSTDSPFNNSDTTPPAITGLTTTAVTGRTATVKWTTTELSTSRVDYGPTTTYGSSTKLDASSVTTHAVGLAGLTPGATYHYRVTSTDVSGNVAYSPDQTVTMAAGTTAAADIGQWEAARDWPIVAVHQMQLYTGEILMYDAWELPARPRVWNPQTDVFTDVPVPSGIFCSGHVQLPDGKVVIVGGHQAGEVGIKDAFLFDPATRAFTRLPDMNLARWYPTATELPDGKAMVLSGMITSTQWADTPEVFNPATNTFSRLTGISTADMHEGEYPLPFLLPDGKVFAIIPSKGQSRLIDPVAQTYTALPPTQVFNGSAVQVRPGKILYTGGGDVASGGESASRAQVIDMNMPAPAWRDVNGMQEIRYMHNPVMLADGKAMIIGGSATADQTTRNGTVIPEVWDPDTEAFTPVAPHRDKRMYHSTSMLLPDGRVLVAGGGRLAPAADYPTAEIYSPPYLFRGPRPTVTAAPATMSYAQAATLTSPDAATITKAHLVKLASVTHTIDQDQHFVPLTVRSSGTTVTVDPPASAGTAPPGYYMLFLLNADGVPSIARTIQLGGTAPADTQAPTVSMTAPASGATVGGTTAVTASAADNVGVTSVQLQLDGTNLGPLDTAAPYSYAWDTLTATPGSHSLRAVARDAAGNTTTSAAVTVTVNNTAPDTTAPVVSALQARTIIKTGALITWTTDEASTSQLDWGLTTAYGSSTPLDATRVTDHGVNLTALTEGTTYHVRARSRDAAGNEVVTPDLSFTTNMAFGCTMASPAPGTTVGATVNVQANIKGGTGPYSVQFLVDGTSAGGPDTTAPYTYAWDTRTVVNGTHSLTAVATDATADVVNAASVAVTVDNSRPAPVAAYGFDEGAGTTGTDASGNGNTLTLGTGVTWATAGRNGGALSFAGTGDAVVNDSPSLRLTTGMTVESWVRPTGGSGWRTVALKERAGGLSYALYAGSTGGGPAGYVNTGGADVEDAATGALALNAWTHLAVTYDGAALGIHVNGALQKSVPVTGSLVSATGALHIGGNSIWGERFTGQLDDLRVYNLALTPAQIQADMAQAVTTGAVVDTRPPAIGALALGAATRTSATIAWTTDEAASTQLDWGPTAAYGSTTALDATLSAAHAVTLTGLAPGATYHVRARSRDAAGNEGTSADLTVVLNQNLALALTSPTGGSTVGGTVTLSATPTAGDPPYSVQFTIDGTDLGGPDATAPYTATWDSRTVADGAHQVGARATDAGSAAATAAPVAVTVNNARPRPVAAWGFNEAAGTTVADATGNGNTGTLGTGVTRSPATAKYGSALTFAGTGQVSVPDAPGLRLTTGMTVEAWVRPTTVSGWRTVLMKERPGGLSYGVYAAGGSPSRPAGYVNTGGVDLRAPGAAALTANTWVHLAITYDGANIRVYVNGVLSSTTAATGTTVTSTSALYIGGNAVWGERFAGQIDEVRLYNIPLSAADIVTDMNTPV